MFYVDVFNVLFSENVYKTLIRDLNVYASKKYKTQNIKPSLLCPRKECKNTKQITDDRYYCNSCKKEFSPFTGTMFDGVKLSFPKIIGAIYLHDFYKKENRKSKSQNIKLTPQSLAGFLDISKESARQLLGKISLIMSYTDYSSDERIERYSSLNRKTATTERFDFKRNNKILRAIIKTFKTNEEVKRFTKIFSQKNYAVFTWAGSKKSIRKSIIDRMPRDIANFY